MLKTARSANIHVQSPQHLQKSATYFSMLTYVLFNFYTSQTTSNDTKTTCASLSLRKLLGGDELVVSLCAILYLMFIAEFADSMVDIEVYATFVELFLKGVEELSGRFNL